MTMSDLQADVARASGDRIEQAEGVCPLHRAADLRLLSADLVEMSLGLQFEAAMMPVNWDLCCEGALK